MQISCIRLTRAPLAKTFVLEFTGARNYNATGQVSTIVQSGQGTLLSSLTCIYDPVQNPGGDDVRLRPKRESGLGLFALVADHDVV